MDNQRSMSWPNIGSDVSSSGSEYSTNYNAPEANADYLASTTYFAAPVTQYGYPVQQAYSISPTAIPIEFSVESLYEDLDRRKQQGFSDSKKSTTQRRRAQNRASQRAFRERKEKHIKEVEKQYTALEEKYDTLSQSYEALQSEYMLAKKELEMLAGKGSRGNTSSQGSVVGDSSAFDESPFSIFTKDEGDGDGGGDGEEGLCFEKTFFQFGDAPDEVGDQGSRP